MQARFGSFPLIAGFFSLIAGILALTANAQAALITYEISGVASGQIGATTFSNAAVELTGTGDTANITSFAGSGNLNGATIFANPFSTFTVTIGGVGTATVTDQSVFWAIPAPAGHTSSVLIGREDLPNGVPVVDSITGLGLVSSNALAGYTGSTAIGPITDSGGIGFPACGGTGQDPCVATTLGFLSFSSNLSSAPTGQATFVAKLPTVPEPATLFLLGSCLAVFAGGSRFRTRHPGKK